MPTPSMEDHIEQIYLLIENKGYARVSDIAEALSVLPSSVTKMVQKLDKDGYFVMKKYRELVLADIICFIFIVITLLLQFGVHFQLCLLERIDVI